MSLVLSIFLSDILPVFTIATAGFLLARFAKADARTVVRVVFYALLPCLVFQMLITSAQTGPEVTRMIVLGVVIILAMGVVGFMFGKAFRLNGVDLRAFLLVVMISNGGNYGLPVVRFAFGSEALARATIFFLTGSVMTYVVGAFFVRGGEDRVLDAFLKIAKMPSLYGVAAALIALWIGKPIPEPIMRPVGLLADAALPSMIIVLGMQLERAALPKHPRIVVLAVAISLLIAPLVALGLCALLGVSGSGRQAAVTLSSMPVAVVTTILAMEYELAPDFVTATVFLSTILSPLTLTPLIAYLR
jgi:predicted permease